MLLNAPDFALRAWVRQALSAGPKVGEYIDWNAVTNWAANTSQLVPRVRERLQSASTLASASASRGSTAK